MFSFSAFRKRKTSGRCRRPVEVSRTGGDGKELFYISRDFNLMAVDVNTTASTFDAGVPRTLFGLGVGELHARNNFIPSADGKRFLTSRIPPGRGYGSIAVVLDWAAVLRDR